MYTRKQFLKMHLNNSRVLGLSQYLEHIIVPQKIKSRKFITLLLQIVVKCLLASLKFSHYCGKCIKETRNICKLNNMGIIGNIIHDVAIILVQPLPSPLLLRQGSPHKNGLQVYPLPLNLV
jgi:hypothetical protein